MAAVLTTSSEIKCNHGGSISPDGAPKLRVNGSPVVLKAGVSGKSVSATCSTKDNSDKNLAQCKKVKAVEGGEASKLRVNGQPVLLDSLTGTTNGTDPKTGALTATAKQSKLMAV